MAKKIMYKNHCTPQEQISSGGRYYLDSDCGRKLTGNEEFTLGSGTTVYSASETVTTSGESIGNDKDFVFIKNTGDNDVLVSFNGDVAADYVTLLSNGEALAVELRGSTVTGSEVFVQTVGSDGKTSTIEYFTGI